MAQLKSKKSFNPYMSNLQEVLMLDTNFVHGEGSRLFDDDGKAYLDFVAGFGSVPFGHNSPALRRALIEFAETKEPSLVQVSGMPAAHALADKLLEFMPPELDSVWLCNSGTEAVEAAIKAARSAKGCSKIISARNGFHGKTLGSLAATHRKKYQQPFLQTAPERSSFLEIEYGDIDSLSQVLHDHADSVAAVLLEPVQGEGGAIVPPKGYLQAVRELCDKHKVLLILDEIQTGFWRTGARFASEEEQVVPDIMTLAKAMSGGLVPIGACVMKGALYGYEFGMKHSSTFGGNSLCARIALASLKEFENQQDFLERNISERSKQLSEAHLSLKKRFPNVVIGVTGKGLLQGIHLEISRQNVIDRRGNLLCVLSEQENLIPLVCSYLLNIHGIRLAPALNKGNVLRVEPPLTVTESECEDYIAALTRAIELLDAGNTAALCAHFVGLSESDLRQIAPETPKTEIQLSQPLVGNSSIPKIAFLLHPIDYKSYIDFDKSLSVFGRRELQRLSQILAPNIEPFIYGEDRISAQSGEVVHCEFITLIHTAESLIDMGSTEAVKEVAKAVDMARDRGASLVGLGGFTSVVTQGGRKVVNRGIAVTTGNSFTVVSAIDAVQLACRQLGKTLSECRVAVVGSGGSIGSAVVQMLLPLINRLTLVGNHSNRAKSLRRAVTSVTQVLEYNLNKENTGLIRDLATQVERYKLGRHVETFVLKDVVKELLETEICENIQFTTDIASGISDSDIVICATNATNDLIYPENLKPSAVICDMSRPSNTSHRIREERPDVLVIDGGVIEIPNKLDMNTFFGFPQGVIYACMAETVMLGLARKCENSSIGHQLESDTLNYLKDLSQTLGFKLAGLRSFDRPLTSRDWLHIKRFHQTDAKASKVIELELGCSDRAPAPENSVANQDQVNVVQYLLERHIQERKDKMAVIDSCNGITYSQLWEKSGQIANSLAQYNLGVGTRVSIIAYDCLDSVVTLLGLQHLGLTAVIHNPFYQPEQLQSTIINAAPSLVLVSDRCAQHQTHLSQASYYYESLESFVQNAYEEFTGVESPPIVMVPAIAAAICQFTSGTTGNPSLVVHSHRDIINTNVGYAEHVLGIKESDTTFTASRLFFAYGYNSLHMALFRGATAILAPDETKAPIILDMITTHRPTIFFGVPTVYLLLLRYFTGNSNLSSVRHFVSAGEPLSEDIYYAWKKTFGSDVIDGIGCTESLSTYISNRPGQTDAGATGRVVPGFEIKILNDAGQLTKPGEIGTLWLRGNTMSYFISTDENGWFCTNDMMAMDDKSILFYIGRANDILKVGGCWVSPMVIEQAVRQHPLVEDCAVVEKVEMGSLTRPVVYIVPVDKSIQNCSNFKSQIKQFCIDRLPPKHYPHFIEFIDEIPRTVNGKVQRFKLRNLQMSQYAALLGS